LSSITEQHAGARSPPEAPAPSGRGGWIEADPANPNVWAALGLGMGIMAAIHLLGLLLMKTYVYTILFERGWVNFAESFVFSWGSGILLLKYQKLKHQRNALLLDVLPERLGWEISSDNIAEFIDHVYKLPRRLRDSLMVNRIRKALELFETRQNNADVAHMMSTQSEIDSIRIAGSYSLLKVFIWAIPILGFVGTVLGLSAAIGNFQGVMGGATDIDALMGSLGGVTSGLGTSFDTTLLGLIYSIILSFPMSALQKTEDDNLNNIDAYCNETLLPRLDDTGARGGAGTGGADLGDVLDRVATKLTKAQGQYLTDLNSTATLVRQQVENLERRAKEQTDLVQKSFVESMQNLQKTTAKTLESNVAAVTSHVRTLSEALTTLNNVLQSIGEKQVQVQVPRRSLLSRLFGRRRRSRRK
jgi:biopolymer transport protein ExbB/TolQ